jgi:hypothetical protein
MTEIVKKIPDIAYPDDVKKVFSVITYKRDKPEVFGSASLKSQYFSVDYDLFNKVYESSNLEHAKEELYRTFLNMLENIKKLPNIFYMDFKCGLDNDLYVERDRFKNPSYIRNYYQRQYKSGHITKEEYDDIVKISKEDKYDLYEYCRLLWTLRWRLDDLRKGYLILQGNRKKYFKDAIVDKTVVKIDIIAYIDGKFTEFSNVYEIYIGNKNVNLAELSVIDSIKNDIYDYYRDENWFKMLKRIFIIAKIRKDNKLLETLTKLFNSNVGLMYKLRGDIQTLIDLLDAGYTQKDIIKKIQNELQDIKGQMAKVYQFELNNTLYGDIDVASKVNAPKELQSKLEDINKRILEIVNNQASKFIRSNKINYKSYLPSREKLL